MFINPNNTSFSPNLNHFLLSVNTYILGFILLSISMPTHIFAPVHIVRHSFAVNLLNAGANIKTVSALLGHSSIKMTEKYLHVIDSQKKDAMNSLGRISFKRDMVYTVSDSVETGEDIEANAV